MTWKMECSIGGEEWDPGRGLRYKEIMVMPFENCSNPPRVNTALKKMERGRTDIFPGRPQPIKMIQIRKGAKEPGCPAHFIPNDHSSLTRSFDFEYFDYGTITFFYFMHYLGVVSLCIRKHRRQLVRKQPMYSRLLFLKRLCH